MCSILTEVIPSIRQFSLGEDFSIFIGAKIDSINEYRDSIFSFGNSQPRFQLQASRTTEFRFEFLSREESEILKGFQADNMALVLAWFLILTVPLSKVTSTET